MNKEFYSKWKQWQYYIIIGIISLVALFFLPMIGSEAGLAWNVPTTVVGWIVYIVSKLLVATLNILIFHCFILQAKINVQGDPNYVEANNILGKVSPSDTDKIRSPGEYYREVYGKKGVTIFITSVISAVGLTQAVLTFDLISMLTYFFTVLMGLIFGVLQMNQTEIFWTSEYLRYAKKTKKEDDEAKRLAEIEEHSQLVESESPAVAEEEYLQQTDDSTGNIGGTDILESPDSSGDIGDSSESQLLGSLLDCLCLLGNSIACLRNSNLFYIII